MKPFHISINTAHSNQAQPYHLLYILSKSSCPYPHISPPPLPHFYRPTPNHLHSYIPHAQATSIYYTSLPQPHSEHPKDCTRPPFLSFRDTPHIHLTIICSALPRLCQFSAFIAQVSVPYVNTLWTLALKSFPSCDRMHHRLSGWAIAPWT